ncbi:glycosyltransferase family 2 protein [Orrella daihaiensis]|uniref:glycosyltransferase family 2 protein n=1 Tax=Orrella daihaiensis TaxID=2782176 RepID=UPI001FB3836B|nr:glycosyltransferase family 2 protein [Orrella daihaiensis]
MTTATRQLEASTDALLANALQSLDTDPVGARLRLAAAINRGVDKSVMTALLAKSVATDDAVAALGLLKSAVDHDPQSLALWSQYWQVLAAATEAGHRLCEQEDWRAALEQRLRWLNQGAELRAILKFLDTIDAQATASNLTPRCLGYCRWDAKREVIEGWALDRWAMQDPCSLVIEQTNPTDPQNKRQGQLLADSPVDWLAKAGISSVGGFVIKVPSQDPWSIRALSLRFAHGQELAGSPLACSAAIDVKTAEQGPVQSPVQSATQSTNHRSMVDVLVPVFEGREHVLACLESLIKARQQQTTPHEIVVLDDASQDPLLRDALQDLAQKNEIVLVTRAANLGFIRNINRGMALHPERDVVWLNADTRVTGNWLDRLKSAAYAGDNTASATPWSNDGEFMTLAGKGNPEPMPSLEAQQQIDAVISELNLSPEELVAGCGFCFYVKRKAINEVGYLDETDLIDGYGEETDWCLRARQLGWRHVAATNLFVGHAGGQSFGARKRALAAHNNAVIRQRYPLAERLHDDHLKQDPLKSVRETIARARLQQWHPSGNMTVVIKRQVSVGPNKKPKTELNTNLTTERKTPLSFPASDRAESLDHDIELTWQITGTDTAVTLTFNRMQPSLQLNYRLPQQADQLAKDMDEVRAVTGDTRHMPSALVKVFAKVLGKVLGKVLSDRLDARRSSELTELTDPTSNNIEARLANKSLPTGDGLALIVDDLQDPEVVDTWLKIIRTAGLSEGIQFITTQNTPGAQLLRRTARVAPVYCPEGLSWTQWLGLLGVNCAVMLAPETAFIQQIETELNVDLPVVDGHVFIQARSTEKAVLTRKQVRGVRGQRQRQAIDRDLVTA